MKAEDMPSAVVLEMDAAHRLQTCTPKGRKKTREEIKRKLADIAKAEADIAELREYRGKLVFELEKATDEHQEEAHKIQEKMQQQPDAEKRIGLRQQLERINAAFQSHADQAGAKMDAIDGELNDLEVKRYAKPSLERALLTTGNPELLRELSVAKTTAAIAANRSKAAAKALAEYESQIAYVRATQARIAGEGGWLPERLQQPKEKPLVKESHDDDERHELLNLEAATAAKLAAQAAAEVQELEKRIREE